MNSFQEHRIVEDVFLGDILRRTQGLTADQVRQILDHQQAHQMPFGQAAVALGFVKPMDVVWALSQQFNYPYAPTAAKDLNEELVVAREPFSEDVEAFRDLRSQLLLSASSARAPQALAVVSPDTSDGKTFIAANLAVAFSQLPGRTLLVDADLRSARLHTLFDVPPGPGLTSILAGRAEPNVIRPVEHLPNLYLLPAGVVAPNPVELLQQATFSLLLRELLGKFDHVLVDTPAASQGSDARIIAMHCGSALVVARKNRSRAPSLQKLVKQLDKAAVRLGGILMNEF